MNLLGPSLEGASSLEGEEWTNIIAFYNVMWNESSADAADAVRGVTTEYSYSIISK